MFTRRSVLGSGGAALAAAALPLPATAAAPGDFVTRKGTGLFLGGRPYRFAGANLWYAAWLGADAPWGNRDRLRRELDTLAAMDVRNLRIAASAEDSPLRNSVKPAFHGRGGSRNPALADGLAFVLAEIIDELGFPPGVFNLVSGVGPVVGEAIAAHPDVDMVSFTGSTRAGTRVAEVAAVNVTRVHQELDRQGVRYT